jgi:hypothetical protein
VSFGGEFFAADGRRSPRSRRRDLSCSQNSALSVSTNGVDAGAERHLDRVLVWYGFRGHCQGALRLFAVTFLLCARRYGLLPLASSPKHDHPGDLDGRGRNLGFHCAAGDPPLRLAAGVRCAVKGVASV